MLIPFFFKLREAGVPVSITEFLTLLEALAGASRAIERRGFLLPVARLPGEGRAALRSLRPRVRRALQGRRGAVRSAARAHSAGMAAAHGRAHAVGGREGEDRSARRLGQADRDAEEAARRAEGAAPGRQQMDRHRRHVAVRRVRLQPGRHPHRPGRVAQPSRGEGLGPARVPQSRRHRRARHAQHQDRAAQAAHASRARARPTSSTSTARSTRPRATPGCSI